MSLQQTPNTGVFSSEKNSQIMPCLDPNNWVQRFYFN